jgi:hypothetical protein
MRTSPAGAARTTPAARNQARKPGSKPEKGRGIAIQRKNSTGQHNMKKGFNGTTALWQWNEPEASPNDLQIHASHFNGGL